MLKSDNNNLHFLRETPQIKHHENDKLFSNKLLSKRIMSIEPPSFRVLYYGGASGSVPFTWESQPGTPKHTFSDTSLPPLTPPPSYQSQEKSVQSKRSKSSFLRELFSSRKSSHSASPSFSWSSSSGSSGSYSSPSTPMNWPLVRGGGGRGKPHFLRSRSVVQVGVDDEEDGGLKAAGSPTSMLCFGVRDGASRKFPGRRRLNKAKSALLSIVDHAKA